MDIFSISTALFKDYIYDDEENYYDNIENEYEEVIIEEEFIDTEEDWWGDEVYDYDYDNED